MRLIWLSAILLHAWLFARRMATGDWATGMDVLRGALCLAAVWYTSLKFWRISTIFDARPSRALAFFLILALGHGAIKTPQAAAGSPPWSGVGTVLAVMPAVGVAALALALAFRTLRRRDVTPTDANAAPVRLALAEPSPTIPLFPDFTPHLFRRPPPCGA
jgi:hypothetical protein